MRGVHVHHWGDCVRVRGGHLAEAGQGGQRGPCRTSTRLGCDRSRRHWLRRVHDRVHHAGGVCGAHWLPEPSCEGVHGLGWLLHLLLSHGLELKGILLYQGRPNPAYGMQSKASVRWLVDHNFAVARGYAWGSTRRKRHQYTLRRRSAHLHLAQGCALSGGSVVAVYRHARAAWLPCEADRPMITVGGPCLQRAHAPKQFLNGIAGEHGLQ